MTNAILQRILFWTFPFDIFTLDRDRLPVALFPVFVLSSVTLPLGITSLHTHRRVVATFSSNYWQEML